MCLVLGVLLCACNLSTVEVNMGENPWSSLGSSVVKSGNCRPMGDSLQNKADGTKGQYSRSTSGLTYSCFLNCTAFISLFSISFLFV